jgi:hypothetical protein
VCSTGSIRLNFLQDLQTHHEAAVNPVEIASFSTDHNSPKQLPMAITTSSATNSATPMTVLANPSSFGERLCSRINQGAAGQVVQPNKRTNANSPIHWHTGATFKPILTRRTIVPKRESTAVHGEKYGNTNTDSHRVFQHRLHCTLPRKLRRVCPFFVVIALNSHTLADEAM